MKPYLALFVFFILFSAFPLFFASSEGDFHALLKLKDGLIGPAGTGLHDWDPSASTHCSFSGRDRRIPPFMADLPNLEVLQVWENNFIFELPEGLGRNGRLVKLDVATNRLTGTIPPDLCAGGRLELLVLMENVFFRPIPKKLGDCKSLVHVRLAKNFTWIADPASNPRPPQRSRPGNPDAMASQRSRTKERSMIGTTESESCCSCSSLAAAFSLPSHPPNPTNKNSLPF